MAKEKRPWTVTPHSDLKQIDDNLWSVENMLPSAPIQRRMSIIRRSDGTLLFYHAIPVDDATLAKIRALGEPKYLVVGHDMHTLDAHAFQEKLALKTYGPKTVEAGLKQKIRVDGTLEDIPKDPTMEIFSAPGSKSGEATIVLKSGGGARVSILISDAIQMSDAATLPLLFRLMGFGGGPKVVPMYRMLFTSDKAKLREAFLTWAEIPNLTRLVLFHGPVLEGNASETLKKVAATL